MLDTGSDITLILKRLTVGIELGFILTGQAVEHTFKARHAMVKGCVGPIDELVNVVVVPSDYKFKPLICMDVGESMMLKSIVQAQQHRDHVQRDVQVRIVQTRVQKEQEETAEALEARSREHPRVKSVDEAVHMAGEVSQVTDVAD